MNKLKEYLKRKRIEFNKWISKSKKYILLGIFLIFVMSIYRMTFNGATKSQTWIVLLLYSLVICLLFLYRFKRKCPRCETIQPGFHIKKEGLCCNCGFKYHS